MVRKATVSYGESAYDKRLRYIHKYYLPLDLRRGIFPVDIDGIESCLGGEAECDLRQGIIPDNCSDCLIFYEDIGLEKLVEGQTARRVLLACVDYLEDCRAELTANENRAAMNLNAWLIEWEKNLLIQCIRLSEEMERRARSGDVWLTDYEMDLEVSFYVRDDDPFSEENMPDAGADDIDRDAALILKAESLPLCLPISKEKVETSDYWGVGDDKDHNHRHGLLKEEIYSVRHCATFHELYDHLHLPMKHMGRIGRVYAEVIISHQNGVRIDLAGEVAEAVQDESRVRQEFVLNDDTNAGSSSNPSQKSPEDCG